MSAARPIQGQTGLRLLKITLNRTPPRSELVKINFKLSAEDRAQGVDAENLWAENLGSWQSRVSSIPFYVYGLG